jgi:phage repressor protein C with HTH and peptisase S24 domain
MHPQMERLYRAAKELRGINSKADLARALNHSFQTVKNWETRGISKAGMLSAQAELGCSATWLETGEGDMTMASLATGPLYGLPPGTFRPVVVVDENDPRITVIPKVRLRLTAGISGFEVEPELEDPSTSTVPTRWIQERGFKKQHLIAIDVRGESMEPTFYAGDTVVLNTADKEPTDGAVFAINYEGEPIVKRMTRDAGEWWLTSDNVDQRRFPRKLCQGDGCIIIGRVVRRETERF